MEKLESRLQFELVKFFNVESPYTKEHSLYLANEVIIILKNIGLKGKVENNKKTDTIKTTFDLRTCFVNMQDEDGWIILDETQMEEILKQIEK